MDHNMTECMERGIRMSSVVVVLLSQAYLTSAQCQYELNTATQLDKERVVCVIDPGYWKDWRSAEGAPSLPVGGSLLAQLRLSTHLYADLSEARAEPVSVSGSVRGEGGGSCLHKSVALPRLLKLLESRRKSAVASTSNVTMPAANAQSTQTAATAATVSDSVIASTSASSASASVISSLAEMSMVDSTLAVSSPPLTSAADMHSASAAKSQSQSQSQVVECGICFEELSEEVGAVVIRCNGPSKHPLCAQCFCGEGNLLHQTSRKYRYGEEYVCVCVCECVGVIYQWEVVMRLHTYITS
jgi:hypothetical protein